MKNLLEAGKIVNTHGIKGELKIQPWVDSAEFLANFKEIYISGKPHKILSHRVHKNCLLVELEGVSDVYAAMALKNKPVYIDRSQVKLPRGHFFLTDIMGSRVLTEDGTELGKLTDIIETASNNVYVITGEREVLIPAVPEFIIKTDVGAGEITVRLIEGM